MQQLLIHFDVEFHFVKLQTFLKSATAAQQAVDAVSRAYFGDTIAFELVVFPPENGSLKQVFGITLKAGVTVTGIIWALVQVMDSQSVQEISTKLLGATPSQMIVNRIQSAKLEIEETDAITTEVESWATVLLEELVSRSARRSLEISREELQSSELDENLKYEIASAQAELFEGVLSDSDVHAIGFDQDDDFPIPRNQFAERAVLPRKPKIDDDEMIQWGVGLKLIVVSSPQFDRKDQKQRKWKGKDVDGNSVLFEIEDQEFWSNLDENNYDFSGSTTILVQMATKLLEGKAGANVALRVLEIESKQIAEALDENALSAILGSFEDASHEPTICGQFDF